MPTLKALDAWTAAAPTDPEPLILTSRACYWYVYLLEAGGDVKRKMALLARGLEAGKKAALIAPGNPGGEYWAATNLGVYSKLRGVFQSVSSLGEIRARLDRAQKLEPNYFYGGIYRYYARLIDQVPASLRALNGYDLDDAVAFYRKAQTIEPRYLQSYVWLAECLLQKGDREEARRQLLNALRVDTTAIPELAPENRLFQRKARELLQKEFGEPVQ